MPPVLSSGKREENCPTDKKTTIKVKSFYTLLHFVVVFLYTD